MTKFPIDPVVNWIRDDLARNHAFAPAVLAIPPGWTEATLAAILGGPTPPEPPLRRTLDR